MCILHNHLCIDINVPPEPQPISTPVSSFFPLEKTNKDDIGAGTFNCTSCGIIRAVPSKYLSETSCSHRYIDSDDEEAREQSFHTVQQ